MAENGVLGKKVIFLYPPPVLTETVDELTRREFEVYLAKDHERLLRLLPSIPDSILFVNLDTAMGEPAWEAYLRKIQADPSTAAVGLGVLSLTEDPVLMQKYLMELQLPCGYVTLKIGMAKTAEILVKTLEANEARGRRRFVRAICPPGMASGVVDLKGETLRASVSDLSSAGVALRFESGESLKPGTVLKDLSLAVKGGRILVDGFVAARREPAEGEVGSPHHIVMFDPASINEAKREKLQALVFRVNQNGFERLLQSV